ncbi:DUF2690 domain-containing protein [Salinispora arenicola]|uniref:DUF2690 domain-containing protein n=1 Tax=Salinispora arenicola TaxID=168697 RepID=UPI0009B8AF26|nr:DUF2690 domain-containing protein [Salinispora arenicola]MCN0152332.1 YjfA family protein [Salinispora arenicola]
MQFWHVPALSGLLLPSPALPAPRDQAPALAATSGCGSVCDGKDPNTYYATVDGTTAQCNFFPTDTPYTSQYVELRYSPFCRTAWARQTGSFGWLSGVLVQSFNTNGTLRKTVYDSNSHAGPWSGMVNNKGLTARACFYHFENEWDHPHNPTILNCTARY